MHDRRPEATRGRERVSYALHVSAGGRRCRRARSAEGSSTSSEAVTLERRLFGLVNRAYSLY